MTAKLFFLSAICTSFLGSAQVLESDNFNSLNAGHLVTSTDGKTPGQGNWYAYDGTVDDYNIQTIDAAHGNSLSIIGSVDTNKFVFNGDLYDNDGWNTRTAENDILKVSFEIYTGNPAGGTGSIRSMVYDEANFSAMVGIGYDYERSKIQGYVAASASGNSGLYGVTLGNQTFPINTWVKVAYTFDTNTGKATWTTPEATFSMPSSLTPTGAGLAPVEQDFISTVTTANTVAHTSAVDNYKMEAVSSTNLGTVESKVDNMVKLNIFPNPATDFLNFSENIKSAQVFDISGKMILSNKDKKDSIDVRSLKSGVYIIKIETEHGSEIKKFIKK